MRIVRSVIESLIDPLDYALEVWGLRGIEEVGRSPVPAYLTAGDSCANPMEEGLYL